MFSEIEVKAKMDKIIENLESRFTTIRAGRANPNLLSGLMVSYYGAPTPIQSLANISVPEARILAIKPFDKGALKDIEKAIYESNIGIAPTNNGEVIMLTIPELTEETRKVYVKQAKEMSEEAKIALRNIRQDENNKIKKMEKSENEKDIYLESVQKIIDNYNLKVDSLYKTKETELMTI